MFWSGILPTKFGGHRALLSNLTPGWPRMTPTWPLTPAMHYALVRGSSHKIWWPKDIAKQIDPYSTPADPYMTFDPNNALRSGQGFFPPNLVAIGHLLSNLTPTWPQLTPTWPLTPVMYYTLVSDSFHQIWWPFLSNLTLGWPQMTPAWPLNPAMHYTQVRGSYHQIW